MQSVQEQRAVRELKILADQLRIATEQIDSGHEFISVKEVVKNTKNIAVGIFEDNYGNL